MVVGARERLAKQRLGLVTNRSASPDLIRGRGEKLWQFKR
jgi:hypothetical protein